MRIVTDIGGTNMRVAAVSGDSIGDVQKIPTPQNFNEGVRALALLARSIAKDEGIEEIVGCIAGTVNDRGVLIDARNLTGWEGSNIIQALSVEIGAPVWLGNDGGLVGLGEAVYGAGKGASSIVYVTVSTGVGGALIKDGKIIESGGVGRTQIDGTDLESAVSGTAVAKKFGIHPKDLTSLDEREKMARILGKGLAVILKQWPAEMVVVGGSMIIGMNPLPIEAIQRALNEMDSTAPEVRKAKLGDSGGLYGGLARLTQLRS